MKNNTLFAFSSLICLTWLFCIDVNADQAEYSTEGKNSPIVTNVTGNVEIIYKQGGISLKEHEEMLRKEIKRVEKELRKSGDEKTKKLVDKLGSLRRELEEVVAEKEKLSSMVYEYQKQFSALISNKTSFIGLSELSPEEKAIIDFEKSEESRVRIVKQLVDQRKVEEITAILLRLIEKTESMDNDERTLWRTILPAMTFDQQVKLLNVLSVERRKLADLERKYTEEIRALNIKHQKEWIAKKREKQESEGKTYDARLSGINEEILNLDISALRSAEHEVKNIIRDFPDRVEGYLLLVDIFKKYNQNRNYEIVELLLPVSDRFSNNQALNKEVAFAYLRMNENRKAYPFLKRAATLDPTEEQTVRVFSLYAKEFGDAGLSKILLQQAYDSNKDNANTVIALSNALNDMGERDKSIKVLESYLDLIGDNVLAEDANLGEVLKMATLKGEKYARANSLASVLNALAWRYFEVNDYKTAITYFKRSISLNENSYNSNVMLGISLVEEGQSIGDAIKYFINGFDSIMKSKSTSDADKGETALAVAIAYSELGQYDKAIPYSSIAVKNTFGCSRGLMKDKLNWRPKMISLLDKNRAVIGCP